MNKTVFMSSLREQLEKNQVQNIDEILLDYDEHFVHGLASGKAEEQIADGLGSPASIASSYQTEAMIQKVKDPEQGFDFALVLKIIGRLLLLAPLNFLIFFIPGAILFALMSAGWSAAIAVASGSIYALIFIPGLFLLSLGAWAWIAAISAALGLFCLGASGILIMFLISKSTLLAVLSYLQWNLKFVTEKSEKGVSK